MVEGIYLATGQGVAESEKRTSKSVRNTAKRIRARRGRPRSTPGGQTYRSSANVQGVRDSWRRAAERAAALERARQRERARQLVEQRERLRKSRQGVRDTGFMLFGESDQAREIEGEDARDRRPRLEIEGGPVRGPNRYGRPVPTEESDEEGRGRRARISDLSLEGTEEPLRSQFRDVPGLRVQVGRDEAERGMGQPRADVPQLAESDQARVLGGPEAMDTPMSRMLLRSRVGDDADAVYDFLQRVADWEERQGATEIPEDADGQLGTSDRDYDMLWTYTGTSAAPWALIRDPETGDLTVEHNSRVTRSILSNVSQDPELAAAWQQVLAAAGAYGSGSEKYAQYRLGQWTTDDTKALVNGLTSAAMIQHDLVAQLAAGTLEPGDAALDLEGIIAEQAERAIELADAGAVTEAGGSSSSYGGGFSYGGGGGGYTAYQTDPALIRQMGSGIARARLGRALTPEEATALVEAYHAMEASSGDMRMDPESNIAEWIEQNLLEETQGEQLGFRTVELVQFLMGGGLSGRIG